MARQGALRGVFVLLVTLPVTMANSFVESPGVVRGDVTGSTALEWKLESEPGRDDAVGFTFNGDDVFRYIPHTGVIPPRVIEGPDGNPQTATSYDPRFSIYNTSTRGVGFRLAGLRPEDAGTYTCRYESLSPKPIAMNAVLFVYEVPDEGPAANPSDTENIIIGVLAAVACVSITISIVLVVLAFRRGLFVCKKGDREPAGSTPVYVNAGRVGEPGNPVADYVNCRTDMAYKDVTPTPRKPALPSDMVREDGLDSVPVTSGEHDRPVVGGVYEPVDQRTREPVRPADKVYAALRNASA